MEFYLQQGWGMKNMAIDLSNHMDSTNLIMSPRDTSKKQFTKWPKEFKEKDIKMLFDPQLYYPKLEHSRLAEHDYWDSSYITKLSSKDKNETEVLIESILEYNVSIDSDKFIIPSAMFEFNDNWFELFSRNSITLIEATNKIVKDREVFLTVALPSNLLNYPNKEFIDKFLITVENFEVDGYYLIAEPINNSYPCRNPLWLSNFFNICAGLKLQGRKVIVGYANQQFLSLAITGVDAIASGNHLNCRKFTNKFEDVKKIRMGAMPIYYYNSKALSEYPLEMLDYAMSVDEISSFKPDDNYNIFTENIFDDILPSDSMFKETASFKHYLYLLYTQTINMKKDTYESTYKHCEELLNRADQEIKRLEKLGIYAENRGMGQCIAASRTALKSVNINWGDQLSLEWENL